MENEGMFLFILYAGIMNGVTVKYVG